MNKEDAKKVIPGQILSMVDFDETPGREEYPFPVTTTGNKPLDFKVERIHVEPSGHVHFDIGLKLSETELPLSSRDTKELIDGSNTYWMHPSRFNVKQ